MILIVLFCSPKCYDSTLNICIFPTIPSLNSQTFPHQIETKHFHFPTPDPLTSPGDLLSEWSIYKFKEKEKIQENLPLIREFFF